MNLELCDALDAVDRAPVGVLGLTAEGLTPRAIAEAGKYPPATSLLSIPFHRRLLWWYVGRAAKANRATIDAWNEGQR